MGVEELESNCSALGAMFQGLITDMRDSVPAFEEFISKTTKLHSTLRASMVSVAAFLEAFQKVADMATGSRGATKEIGKSLTRLCLRHRSIENKLKIFTSSLMEDLVVPLQEKLEEWKKNALQIDKDHAKDYKKARSEIKRASTDTIRLQKKSKKGKGDAKEKLENAMDGISDKYGQLEDCEKRYVRKALIEERKHYCDVICCMRPVVDAEMSMMNEVVHLQEILDILCSQAADPDTLPETSEQAITDIKGTTFDFKPKTPPDSPTSDRHSLYSSVNSLVYSNDSETTSQRSSSPANRTATIKSLRDQTRLISNASQDSGFTSQDALHARPHSVLTNQLSSYKRSHGSLEEERSDSVTSYSSIGSSQSNHDYDTISLHSANVQSASVPVQLRSQVEKAHTISGVRPIVRPSLTSETYIPPLLQKQRASSSEHDEVINSDVPRPSRSSSQIDRSSTHKNNKSILPARPKAKPVAVPSVPFMNTEPVYMNTQELAKQIAERRKTQRGEDDRQSLFSETMKEKVPTKPPSTDQEEIQAQNSALADAIKELEASTAALNDCLDETDHLAVASSRQSFVSSSGYSTTTSNSSAGEDIQTTVNGLDQNCSIGSSSHLNQINEQPHINTSTTGTVITLEGIEVTNWAGKAVLRRPAGSAKPPPPVRRSSSVTSQLPMESVLVQKQSRPPSVSQKPTVTSPKRSLSSPASDTVLYHSHSSSDSFPAPPPLLMDRPSTPPEHHYAVPNCQPIMDSSPLPPPPPEFSCEPSDASVWSGGNIPPPLSWDAHCDNHIGQLEPSDPGAGVSSKLTLAPVIESTNSTTSHKTPPWEHASQTGKPPRGPPPPVLAKNKTKLNTNFLATLDASLSSRPPTAAAAVGTGNAARVPGVLSGRAKESPPRQHLLAQIQTGVQLRKTAVVKDRSGPVL